MGAVETGCVECLHMLLEAKASINTTHPESGYNPFHFAALLDRVENAAPFEPMPILFLPPYHALGYDRFDAQTVRRLAAAYAGRGATVSGAPSASAAAKAARKSLARARRKRGGDGRLVVGFLSPDFGDHPTSHLMRSVWVRVAPFRS